MHNRALTVSAVALIAAAVGVSQCGTVPDSQARDSLKLQAFGAIQPRMAPAGDWIAFSYQGAIWRVPRSGGVMSRLTHDDGFDIEPAWSPDGKRIAFISSPNFFGGEIHIVDVADRSISRLPATVQAQGKLHFHPDGKRILGNIQTRSSAEALGWLDVSSGAFEPVLRPPRAARRLSLSADGEWIAFVTTLDVAGEQTGNDGPQNDLWKVAARGGEPELIARFPSRIYDTCWAADGRSLFVTTDFGAAQYDLWQIPVSGSLQAARQITFGQADEDRPSVSHDSHWLAYMDNRLGVSTLMVRDLVNGSEQPVIVSKLDFAAPAGTLRLRVVDKQTGNPAVARVVLHERPGKFHAPPDALYRLERTSGHFYCRSDAEFAVPAGPLELSVYRGPETRAVRRQIRIEPGKTLEQTIELERWENFSALGYYSGENHIHANYGYGEWYNTPGSMLDQCEGEDLNVCNFMVANSDGDGVFDRRFFRGQADATSQPATVLYWNQEFRSTLWGHMTLVGLRQVVEPVFTGFKDTTNPWDIPTNADVADRTHWQHGLVNYTHPAQNVEDPYLGAYTAKGVPVDCALGKVDSMDVMGSNHRAAIPLWYRLLNCGFRVPASAGTDCFLNRVRSRLPGSDRAYVYLGHEFSYSGWIEGLRAGRTFVTNGPLLEMTVAGLGTGKTLELSGAQEVAVTARVRSQFPLDRLEIVYNGTVVGAAEIGGQGTLDQTIDRKVSVDRSGWIAVRASGPAHADHPSFELYAHTSPVYVSYPEKPVPARTDARFFLAWIDRLEASLRKRDRVPNPDLKAHVESQLAAAREIYRKLAEATE